MSKRKKTSPRRIEPVRSGRQLLPAHRVRALAGVAILFLAVFAVYYPAIDGKFIWDDTGLVSASPLIHASDGLYQIWCTTKAPDYWPITNTAFWIEWRLWGDKPLGYHVVNFLLHGAAAALIWMILKKISLPGAFLAALLFAVHPLNVESVAWISQLKNTLSLVFFLLSMLWYLLADEQSPPEQYRLYRPGAGRWYWLSLAAFLLAMLSKGSVAILPALLLLVAWWRRKLSMSDGYRTLPFFLVAIVLTVVNIWFQGLSNPNIVLRHASFIERLLGAGGTVWFYFGKTVWPAKLTLVYPLWDIRADDFWWWLSLMAVLAVTGLFFWRRQGWGRPFLFAWIWFCMALVPVMGFTDVGFMRFSLVADRYAYIAMISIVSLAAAAWGIANNRGGILRQIAAAVAVAVVGTLGWLTHEQSSLYRDSASLFSASLKNNPQCWVMRNNLGDLLLGEEKYDEARVQLEHALKLQPDNHDTNDLYGTVLYHKNRFREAIPYYKTAIRSREDYAPAYNHLGSALAKLGEREEAVKMYRRALEISPKYFQAYQNMAFVYESTNQIAEAIETARKARDLALAKGNEKMAGQIDQWIASLSARSKAAGTEKKRQGK
jgi:protein O-mannosyl-transferase